MFQLKTELHVVLSKKKSFKMSVFDTDLQLTGAILAAKLASLPLQVTGSSVEQWKHGRSISHERRTRPFCGEVYKH